MFLSAYLCTPGYEFLIEIDGKSFFFFFSWALGMCLASKFVIADWTNDIHTGALGQKYNETGNAFFFVCFYGAKNYRSPEEEWDQYSPKLINGVLK